MKNHIEYAAGSLERRRHPARIAVPSGRRDLRAEALKIEKRTGIKTTIAPLSRPARRSRLTLAEARRIADRLRSAAN